MWNNNKGLTLVELIVTIAMIGVFAGVVASVITLGSNTFRRTSGNAAAQMEVQQVLDQIQDLAIDANRGVYYCLSSDGSAMGAPISGDMGRDVTASKAFWISRAESDVCISDVVWWDAQEEKLYDTKRSYRLEGGAVSITSSSPNVLAENVTAFCADTSRVEKEQVLRFEVAITKKGQEIRLENSVSLRNKVQLKPPPDAFILSNEEN
ncbi:MAG: type II secretion system protein [Eubacteriales bacterium]|nr:type II secretion system protein [Eubacteriales bacterium]